MKMLALLFVLLCYRSVAANVIVVPETAEENSENSFEQEGTPTQPVVYKFHITSDIKYRYARTVISSKVVNPTNISQEVHFAAVLPETAFISGFLMEVDGQVYRAYVREKEAARQEYSSAVRRGSTAAHVSLSARDSNRFTVSVNVERQKKVAFNLTYEELLSRKLGTYKHVINIDPGQIVNDFGITVRIEESSNITTLKVLPLRMTNEIISDPSAEITNPLADIERSSETTMIRYNPTPDQQRELAADGVKGQFIVEYDVNRSSNPGEVLVNDGYFVHFFSPVDLTPLRKQVTFVLDVSGSMEGRKLEQLKQAMTTILDDLNQDDLFSIVIFSSNVHVWEPIQQQANPETNPYRPWKRNSNAIRLTANVIVTASRANITKAKEYIQQLEANWATNIHEALFKALQISMLNIGSSVSEQRNDVDAILAQKPEPIIIFLTDGDPTEGETNTDRIVEEIMSANVAKSSIYSLALGSGSDFNFLKKLSLHNSGFARKIYEASDTALQLTDFYRQVSSPLLSHVNFTYLPEEVEQSSITKVSFRRLFSGSELVVAGKIIADNFTARVEGKTVTGRSFYPFTPIFFHDLPPIMETNSTNTTAGRMERLWAYLTIKQLLEAHERSDTASSPEKQRALQLALTYSFVTPLTSLVVVKPNITEATETEDAYGRNSNDYRKSGAPIPVAPRTRYRANSLPSSPEMASEEDDVPETPFRLLVAPRLPSGQNSRLFSGFFSNRLVSGHIQSDRLQVWEPPTRRTTTTTTTPAPYSALRNLNDITWLAIYSFDNTLIIPSGVNGTYEYLRIASSNKTNRAYDPCTTTLGEPGHCRHLRYCVMDVFTSYAINFVPYVCHINLYVGVCCPDIFYP